MIRHAALFRLIHSAGSAAEADFLRALHALKDIPGVRDFQITREISPKNGYDYAVSMTFADQGDYDAYNSHPEHESFVKTRWQPEVADFMEHDTQALEAQALLPLT